MLYDHTSELAVRALLYLTMRPPGQLSTIREIARGTALPGPYLAKVLRPLIRVGLVRAFRGPGGGLELGRAPGEISLLSVVQALDGEAVRDTCVLGLRRCCADSPCPLHQRWFPLQQQMQKLLEETTLASLVHDLTATTPLTPASWMPASGSATHVRAARPEKRRCRHARVSTE